MLLLAMVVPIAGQTSVKSLPVNLSKGEELLQVAALKDRYAALTIHMKDDPQNKRYYILTDGLRKGPYNEVKDLQSAFDTSAFIYAARNESDWYVYEGTQKYGPFSSVSKVRSGDKKHRCMFLATKGEYRQVLYNRHKVFGGNDIISDCYDYALSADGSSYAYYMSGLMADYFLYKNDTQLGTYGHVEKMQLSDDGRDVAFLFERNPLEYIAKGAKKEERYCGLIRYMYPGSFGEFAMIDTLDNYMRPGDVDFYRKNYYPGYYYSCQDSKGAWKLFHNRQDMNVKEREIHLVKAMPDGSVIYAAKPAESGPNNLDTTQFYIYVSQQVVNGPYLEIRQLLPSGNGSFMAIEGRQAAGWYLVLPSGGIGPFDDIQPAEFLGDAVVGFKAMYQGEWASMLMTGQGMTIGSIVKDAGKPIGIGIYSEGNINIYLQ